MEISASLRFIDSGTGRFQDSYGLKIGALRSSHPRTRERFQRLDFVSGIGICASLRKKRKPHPWVRRFGIAQLTRHDLSELLKSQSASKAVWSALRAGASPFVLDSQELTSKQAALKAFDVDDIFAMTLKPEAVEHMIEEAPGEGVASTHKFLLRLHDGFSVESVLIPNDRRLTRRATTICISSQVGCAQGCCFCRTGTMGLLRNLSTEEIIAQVVQGRRLAKELSLPRVLKVVFMGMGEPLANLSNVKQAVEALSDMRRMGFARKRLQISTVAPSPHQVLALKGMRCQLVWSLHSPCDTLRAQLVPTSLFSTMELREAFLTVFRSSSGNPDRRFMVAVVMIAGVNDQPENARELAEFLIPFYEDPEVGLSVNLIPYNENPELSEHQFAASDVKTVQKFRKLVNESLPGMAIHIRETRGANASSACGQLATVCQKPRHRWLLGFLLVLRFSSSD